MNWIDWQYWGCFNWDLCKNKLTVVILFVFMCHVCGTTKCSCIVNIIICLRVSVDLIICNRCEPSNLLLGCFWICMYYGCD